MKSDIDRIKEKLSIVDVVSPYVKLTHAGGSYKGLSPFASEKSPSFFVSPDKGLYHCFSSGKGGDMFTFIQEIEGIDFRESLVFLAEKAGVTLTNTRGNNEQGSIDILRDALEKSCQLFEEHLSSNEDVKKYIKDRGITEASTKLFRLGYAVDSFNSATDSLKSFDKDVLVNSGLARKKENGHIYDYFRDRVMFPIFDAQGRIAGYSGRAYGPETTPKYLNSPDTLIFDKSGILYGLHLAKQAIRKFDCAILVEGQVDLVMSHQVGFSNTVAVSGTGLTERHLSSIKYLTSNLIFAFDADKAGINSAVRAATKAIPMGFNVKMIDIPSGKDPADYIHDHGSDWKKVIAAAEPVVLQLAKVVERTINNRERFEKVISQTLLPLITLEQHEITQDKLINKLSRVTLVPVEILKRDFANLSRPHQNSNRFSSAQSLRPPSTAGRDLSTDAYSLIEWSEKERVSQTLDDEEKKLLTQLKEHLVYHPTEEIVEKGVEEESQEVVMSTIDTAGIFWLDTQFELEGNQLKDRNILRSRKRYISDLLNRYQLDKLEKERSQCMFDRRDNPDRAHEFLERIMKIDQERTAILHKMRSGE